MCDLADGQLALLDVLSTVCRGIDGETAQGIVHDIARQEPRCSISRELKELQCKALLVDELSLRNEKLQADLTEALKELTDRRKKDEREAVKSIHANPNHITVSALSNGRRSTPVSTLAATESGLAYGSSPANEGITPVDLADPVRAAAYIAKYKNTRKAYENAMEALTTAATKWKSQKESANLWIKHAESLQKKLDSLTTPKVAVVSPDFPSSPPLPNIQEVIEGVFVEPQDHQQHSDSTEDRPDDTSDAAADHVTDESNQVPVFIKEESPDLPVVISSRQVNKRRAVQPELNLEEHLTKKIKHEHLSSSSPIGMARFARLQPHESMDLDFDGHVGTTPRKVRQSGLQPRTTHRLRLFDNNESSNETPTLAKNNSLAVDIVGQERPQQLQTPTSVLTAQRRPRQALRSRDTNARMILSTAIGPNKRRRDSEERARGAEIFAEDGDDATTRRASDKSLQSPEVSKLYKKRLDGLLEAPAARSPILKSVQSFGEERRMPKRYPPQRSSSEDNVTTMRDSRPTPAKSDLDWLQTPAFPSKAVKRIPVMNRTPVTASTIRKQGLKTKPDLIDLNMIDPSHEPFRALPLSKLSLEHFKPNPAYNQGQDFAFTSVTRGREQRKCLDGCTDPSCCGTGFRKMAEEILANHPDVLTNSQDRKNIQLIEEHLGPDPSRTYKADTTSEVDRRELLLQAKTKDLAKKSGKHRFTYSRKKSPPGFWDTHFPDTQEQQEYRAMAKDVERGYVEERLAEARKTGGKWLFRDE